MADENQASPKYLELVGIIEAAENSAPKADVSFIDFSDPAFEAASSQQPPSYEDLVAVIEEIETGKHVVHQPTTQQKAAPQPQRQPQPQQVQAPPQAPPQAAPPTTPPAEVQRAEAGRELGTVAQRLASAMPRIKEMRRRRINVKDLVLPNLSTADQISELERIIEGLRENVFDGEHLPGQLLHVDLFLYLCWVYWHQGQQFASQRKYEQLRGRAYAWKCDLVPRDKVSGLPYCDLHRQAVCA